MTRKEVSRPRCRFQCQIGQCALKRNQKRGRQKSPSQGDKLPIDTYMGGSEMTALRLGTESARRDKASESYAEK